MGGAQSRLFATVIELPALSVLLEIDERPAL